jgi:ATP-binding cassette subfamily B protein
MKEEKSIDSTKDDVAAGRQPRSSRRRYLKFVQDYKQKRLDEVSEATSQEDKSEETDSPKKRSTGLEALGIKQGKRREYLREYLRWLWPHRFAVAALAALALMTAGMEMAAPLFMRFIVDRVLLNTGMDTAKRLAYLQLAGALFLAVVVMSHAIGVVKDYRQRMLNIRVMLSLRKSLFDRLLHLPLARLWEMKTGGILSRLSGDVDTTTGLLQMAIVSPAISILRLAFAVGILFTLNARLAFMALAIIPGAMLMSFVLARRRRPV